ncbi:14563_t:CDS:2 [Cetraspora pellucida]|uniref:14563_t:CDS:1 n=1 Tax=Cetraspora pellucida TaxID=1433469 RepID=A0A9N9EDI0_9GLOM|nr:14563_t:CDS:2 [Cetraspora pellucida]
MLKKPNFFVLAAKKTKLVTKFTRQSRNKILKFARCNSCNEQNKQSRKNIRAVIAKIKIEKKLVNENALMPEFNQNNKSENFCKIIDVLVMPLQTKSKYY